MENVDIYEELETKVAKAIQTLETIQLEKLELQDELAQARNTIAEQGQQLSDLGEKNELLNKETIRLTHEKNGVESRISGLMQTLELAVSDAEQMLGMSSNAVASEANAESAEEEPVEEESAEADAVQTDVDQGEDTEAEVVDGGDNSEEEDADFDDVTEASTDA